MRSYLLWNLVCFHLGALLSEMEKDAKEKIFKQSSNFFKYIVGYLTTIVLLIFFLFIYTSSYERKILKKINDIHTSFENIDMLSTFEVPRVDQSENGESFLFEEEEDLRRVRREVRY